jgi:UDP-glucose 4-epimerase
MRFLVTGVAGFIGSHLADRLIADGHEVVGIDNLTTGRAENVHPDVHFVKADISTDNTWWSRDKDGVDYIIHCAASYDDRLKWHRDTNTNVLGGINVAILAKALGARVVYFQTALVYGNNPYRDFNLDAIGGALPVYQPVAPENSYAISKYAAGQYLRHADIPLLELRLANIYGPRNLSGPVPAFWKRITNGEPCTIVDSRRDFVFIDDLVELVSQAIQKEATGTYHVSTGRDYAIGQLYEAVVDALDAHSTVQPTFQPRGGDDAPTILLDPSETQRDFGWRPTTELDEGVQAAVDWYTEHGVQDVYTHLAVKG